MKDLQDTEDPHQSINGTHHEPANSGRHESSLSDHRPSSENNNSSQQQQQQTPTPIRKIKASSRIPLNRILAQQSSVTDGSADEPLVIDHQVLVPVGTISVDNSPPPNSTAQLNQITILHQEAAIQFNGNILHLNSLHCMQHVCKLYPL